MSVMSFIISVKKKPSPKFTTKSEIFPTFFPNSSLWEHKCPVTLRTSKRQCCNFKDGLNSFFSLPVTENVLFIDTMQKAQHGRWDGGGGCGLARGQGGGATCGVKGTGGWASCLMHSKHKPSWNAIGSQRALDARRNDCMQKKPVVVYRKVTFTYVVPGW